MKFALLSDIHGNLPALQAVAADIAAWQPDVTVVCGDVVNRGPCPAGCWAFIQGQPGWQVILGNHEEYVLAYTRPGSAVVQPSFWTYQQLNGQVAALAALPERLTFAAPDGSEMDVFHASARGTQDGIYETAPAGEIRQQIGRAPALVAVGHTHLPFIRQVEETLVVNCGSAGAPCDDDRRASYAQIEWRAGQWRAKIARVAYDLAQTDRDFQQSGFLALGPMADLIYHEWRVAHQVVIPWLRQEKPRVLAGEVTMAESVRGFLQQLGLVS